MPAYDCQPITLWMLGTLLPVATLFVAYMGAVYRWSASKYPRLIEDMNRRKLFEGSMIVGGLFGFIMIWGFAFEGMCRV